MIDQPLSDVRRDLAPAGTLRAAINFGNPVLAQKDEATGEPRGVSVDLARELASRLNVPISLVTFDAAGKVFEALRADAWDVAFLAIDPARATEIAFTAPYVIIEGGYMVREGSPLKTIVDVDQPGNRMTVASKSAYDLYLTRTIQHARILREPTGPEALERFRRDNIEVAAGVKGPLARYARQNPGLRVMDGRFMVIEQAVGTPKDRAAGIAYLRTFVEEMKATGFVAEGLQRSGQIDARVAPPAALPST